MPETNPRRTAEQSTSGQPGETTRPGAPRTGFLRTEQQGAAERSVIDRIRKVLSNTNVDAILLYNPEAAKSNFLYLTGFTSGIFERNFLLVFRDRETLITDSLEHDTAASQKPKEMDVVDYAAAKDPLGALKGKTVGVDSALLPYDDYVRLEKRTGAKFVSVSDDFFRAREVKDADEIASIRKANEIIKRAIEEAFKTMRVGMTEKELAAEVEYRIRQYGGDGTSFDTIVCFGKNSAFPHHAPDDTKLEPNSLVILDCGAKYNNYCSDVTRTVIFQPNPDTPEFKQMQEIIDTVKKAQELAMAKIREGADGGEAYKAASDYINSAYNGKYKGTFTHGLGHQIGLDVHDGDPYRGLRTGTILKKGMVFSNEPGIYVVGLGGARIEDDVLVTETGAEVL